jgi:transposase-like protein
VKNRIEDSQLTIECLRCYKPREIERTGLGTIGIHSRQEQRFLCHECDTTVSARKGTVFYRLRTSAETVVLVVTLLAHGCPLQAIVAACGFDLPFRTLCHISAAILEEPSVEGGSGAIDRRVHVLYPSCCAPAFPFIPTSCKLGSPFLPLQGEPHGFRWPAGRTPDDNQASCLVGPQTLTAVALVPWEGTPQVLLTARAHACAAENEKFT